MIHALRSLTRFAGILICLFATGTTYASNHVAKEAEVTILSSNLANGGTVGEWGLSALAKVDEHCVLFDAGRYPDTVLRNISVLKVDLSCVSDVVLSHFHFDHTTGLIPIIRAMRKLNPNSFKRVHVAKGFFLSRHWPSMAGNGEGNQMIALRSTFAELGVEIIEHERATEILPAVWISGPIPRPHAEKNYPDFVKVKLDSEWVVDHVPDSQALTVVTEEGHIVVMGCGYSGVVNALTHIRNTISEQKIVALMGGLHLFAASDEVLGWTADKLRDIGVMHLMAGHCTGIEPMIRLRAGLNLSRKTAVVGAVGSKFTYGKGITPTAIAM